MALAYACSEEANSCERRTLLFDGRLGGHAPAEEVLLELMVLENHVATWPLGCSSRGVPVEASSWS